MANVPKILFCMTFLAYKFESEKELILIGLSSGEIYNRVAKDEKREFAVEVDSYKVVALGTAFSVEKKEDSEAQARLEPSAPDRR